MSHLQVDHHCIISMQNLKTQKWYAWITLGLGKPDEMFIRGEVEINNTGMRGCVFKKKTDTQDHDILHLELVVEQLSGLWTHLDGWCQIRYREIVLNTYYTMVHIYTGNALIEKFPIVMHSE